MFMELVHKWFVLHNIKNTTVYWTTRDPIRMPFYSADDKRYVFSLDHLNSLL